VVLLFDRFTVAEVAAAVVVQVPVPEPLSKNTLSAATGADAPDAPPEVADQFAVDTPSHVPDPPTQYRAAIR
jgi:hypothetical protein